MRRQSKMRLIYNGKHAFPKCFKPMRASPQHIQHIILQYFPQLEKHKIQAGEKGGIVGTVVFKPTTR